jgi:ectoine hydroxylase-related dioxygenase (phytanoyl-CoA dioxygenase family)
MEYYRRVELPTWPDGSKILPDTDFHHFVLNWDVECDFHKDKSDVAWGFCVVIPFGEFTGGELIFPEIFQSVHLQAGDIMVFPSALLTHGNGAVTSGKRHSLVLNCCAHNFHTPYSQPI